MTTWSGTFPLPPAALSPNAQTHPQTARKAEAAYKKQCIAVWDTCPIRRATHVTLSMAWFCIRNVELKAKPNAKGVVTKTAKGMEPYCPRDVGNAWGAAKYLIDAMCDQYDEVWELTSTKPQRRVLVSKTLSRDGIIKDDRAEWFSGGPCKVYGTVKSRKMGHTKGCIEVFLEIEEDLQLG